MVNPSHRKKHWSQRELLFALKDTCFNSLLQNPFEHVLFYELGKICYLLSEKNNACAAYLAYMHLKLNEYASKSNANNVQQLEKYTLTQVELSIHLAHAFVDLEKNHDKYQKLIYQYAAIYRAELNGEIYYLDALDMHQKSELEYKSFQKNYMLPQGRMLLLQWLKWQQIDCKDVMQLYFEANCI